jgi:hypothetical protein
MKTTGSVRWRRLLEERTEEAVSALGAVPGVRGLVLGGSVGRGEPWPLSDIDMLPISAVGANPEVEIEHRRSTLVDWWAASGRAQSLDVGWLRFTDQEVEGAINAGASEAAGCMSDQRWLHGIDKSYGGKGVADPDGFAEAFANWATEVRFDPLVVAARIQQWLVQVNDARDLAVQSLEANDPVKATLAIREAARALRLVLLEGWGERLSSMGREWTRFQRMARERDAQDIADRLATMADAHPDNIMQRTQIAPAWLQERIDLAYTARQEIGETVTIEENARDQLAAFAVLVPRHKPQPWGAWIGVPAPDLEHRLSELDELIMMICK